MSRFNTRSGISLEAGLTHIGRWTFYYICIGLIAGSASIVFCYLCQLGMRIFLVKNIDSLPVVADEDHRDLIGLLNRREVIAYYNERVQEMKALA